MSRLFLLINELQQRADFNKLVIYAQFERLLSLIAEALRWFGLEFVYVRGSIYECDTAIRRFKSDNNVKIMLLSSENTISGIHLVEANHLIAVRFLCFFPTCG